MVEGGMTTIVCLVIVFLLLAALVAAFVKLRRFDRTTGIWSWHSHRGQMRRMTNSGFEYRPASETEFMNQVDRGAV